MKRIKYIAIASCMSVLLGSCSDFLDVKSEQELTYDDFFKTEDDCRAYTAGLYNTVWYDFNGFLTVLECRSNNMYSDKVSSSTGIVNRFMDTSSTENLEEAWDGLYSAVCESCHILNSLDRALENGVSQEVVDACKAEARFMRGTAYWYLTSLWQNVPIVENPEKLAYDYAVPANRQEDVLQYSIRDLEFAAKYLRETDEKGRVTKYSALGMLSRVYITAACFARGGNFTEGRYETSPDYYYQKAAEAALEVCKNGTQYKLMENYEELFTVQNNNNSESLFAIQFVPGSIQYGFGNRLQTNLAPPKFIGGLTSYGGSTFMGGDLVKLMYDNGEMARMRATCFHNGAYYDYLGGDTEEGYLLVSGLQNNKCTPKKQVVGGPDDTNGIAISGNSGFATPMLRLAEVYLLYAEAVLGMNDETTDAEAVSYFNKVRQRARMYKEHNSELLEQTTPADVTSLTLQDIWNERRLELGGEGQFWFDIVRRAYWDKQWVFDFLDNQERGHSYSYKFSIDTGNREFKWGNWSTYLAVEASDACLKFYYPLAEVTINPNLRNDPVPFDLPKDEE